MNKYRNPPAAAAIDRAIDDLIPALYHYAILEADPPVEQCAYIQTLTLRDGEAKGQYLIEARYLFDGHFKHYRKHISDADEVKKTFRDFAEGTPPNTAGWDDITGKLVSATGCRSPAAVLPLPCGRGPCEV